MKYIDLNLRQLQTFVTVAQLLSFTPSLASETGELTGLRFRQIKLPPLTREIGVIQRAGRSLSPAAESFMKFMKAAGKQVRAAAPDSR